MNRSQAYVVLGVSPSSTSSEIKQAYRRASLVHHPDHGGSAERMKDVTQAYAVLTGQTRDDFWSDFFRRAREQARSSWASQYRARRQARPSWWGTRRYTPGKSCGRGKHVWQDKGNYLRCTRCNSGKTKPRSEWTRETYYSRRARSM